MYNKGSFLALTTTLARDKIAQDSVQLLPQPVTFDYEIKMAEYESLGIPEYWIVDYAGLGGIRHLGKPKQPTLTICTLVLGEYEIQRFRGDELVISGTFPDLNLTATQVLSSE
jgi:Uma2 family endonuclease